MKHFLNISRHNRNDIWQHIYYSKNTLPNMIGNFSCFYCSYEEYIILKFAE